MRLLSLAVLTAALLVALASPAVATPPPGVDLLMSTVMQENQSSISGFALRGRLLLRDPKGESRGIGICIRSLREVVQSPWKDVIEPLIVFDQILREDPSGAYPAMDFDSRATLYWSQPGGCRVPPEKGTLRSLVGSSSDAADLNGNGALSFTGSALRPVA